MLRAQDRWYKTYEEGRSAFESKDFKTAEQKMLAALANRSAPPSRGPNVLQVGMSYGFMPEYYLALIYVKEKRYEEALSYAKTARGYVKAGDAFDVTLKSAETEANAGLTSVDTQKKFDGFMASAESELKAHRFEEARNALGQAIALGLNAPATSALRLRINTEEFNGLVLAAEAALKDGKVQDAKTATAKARTLNVDNAKLDTIESRIARVENGDRAMADARRAITDHRLADAKTQSTKARAFGVDKALVDALDADINREETAALLADGETAIKAGDAAKAIARANEAAALGINRPAADGLLNRAQILQAEQKILPILNAKNYTQAKPLVEALRVRDRSNALVLRYERETTATLSVPDQERAGLRQFYEGQYQAAIDTLTPLESNDRPRAAFYVACSKASLALLEPDQAKKETLRQAANQELNSVRAQIAVFSVDLPYLSPAVRRLLGIADR